MTEYPHIYRNRQDDNRGPGELNYCETCNGYYGVSHPTIHEGRNKHPHGHWAKNQTFGPCACRPCREADGLSREGRWGIVLTSFPPGATPAEQEPQDSDSSQG